MSKDLLTVNFSGRRIAHYILPAEMKIDLNDPNGWRCLNDALADLNDAGIA